MERPFDVLWTPWRMEYIKSVVKEEKPKGCLFCKVQEMDDEEALIVYRGQYNFVMLNAFPYNTGHVMIVPYRHVSSLEELSDNELLEAMQVTKRVMRALRELYSPDGFNVGWNVGRAAGAGIPGHVHLHLVPRWVGDANFMLTIGHTKVLPEALNETWRALREKLN
ncbi:HIT family hydrolase [Ignicoccus islandicus DSM 13165]|uniref:HIT family hydrolase n=2 Tax=Ignicoccus islandicus TaxID=54259 RepID=A0A0U3F732_9CREN|nr:HIT family hydrolase [Ignicoccus islandicus DSM 13165]